MEGPTSRCPLSLPPRHDSMSSHYSFDFISCFPLVLTSDMPFWVPLPLLSYPHTWYLTPSPVLELYSNAVFSVRPPWPLSLKLQPLKFFPYCPPFIIFLGIYHLPAHYIFFFLTLSVFSYPLQEVLFTYAGIFVWLAPRRMPNHNTCLLNVFWMNKLPILGLLLISFIASIHAVLLYIIWKEIVTTFVIASFSFFFQVFNISFMEIIYIPYNSST